VAECLEALQYAARLMQSGRNLDPISGSKRASAGPVRATFYVRHGKRWLDVTLAALALVFLLPLLLMVAGVVLWSSGRPVFFAQMRVGQHGKLFRMYKLRTMVVGAELRGSVSVTNDPRATRMGHRVRKFKLDEIPQLWNVLSGTMSLVGPRPDVPGFADQLSGEDRKVLDLLPGVTGPATLHFANEEALLEKAPDPDLYNREVIFPEKVRINLEYGRDVRLSKDLVYLFKTLAVVRRN